MRQWTVDAFASAPFKGNPACVVEPFDAWPDEAWMQALAAENNQAETAFLLRTADPARFGLRWFTPAIEAPLCGHATLAAAHVLLRELGAQAERLDFETRWSGGLGVRAAGDGLEMDFPALEAVRIDPPDELAEIIGARPLEVWRATYLVAVVEDEATVRVVAPNLPGIVRIGAEIGGRGNLCIVARAAADAPYDAVSRFFGPGSGIPEDPATGSAHCILASLFAEKLGRTRLKFHQAYPGRGADIEADVAGDRVLLRGQAITVIESRLRLIP